MAKQIVWHILVVPSFSNQIPAEGLQLFQQEPIYTDITVTLQSLPGALPASSIST